MFCVINYFVRILNICISCLMDTDWVLAPQFEVQGNVSADKIFSARTGLKYIRTRVLYLNIHCTQTTQFFGI